MANSKYDKYFKDDERATDLNFNKSTYIIVRLTGYNYPRFCKDHDFNLPNDKRALDLMIESAKQVMRTYKKHIPFAYGYNGEYSFLIKSSSNILSRRVFKITSMLPVIFATYYNSNWHKFFSPEKKYDAWFEAKPKEYASPDCVMDYFRWRQTNCHLDNLYNTTLSALTARYVKHELVPVGDGISFAIRRTPILDLMKNSTDSFMTVEQAIQRLTQLDNPKKQNDILFDLFKINYNDELEQFKKGTVIVGDSTDEELIRLFHVDLTKTIKFWTQHCDIFDKCDFINSYWQIQSMAKKESTNS